MGAGDFVVAAHRAFYFLPLYEPLEHHAGIVLQGEVHGRLQLRHVPRLGDAHAGARVGGLDEDGPAQPALQPVGDGVEPGQLGF